jgi:hypothetical protein
LHSGTRMRPQVRQFEVGNDNETTAGLRRRNSAKRTGNQDALIALEQAIVDRELIELVTRGLCDEKRELAGDPVRKKRACGPDGIGRAS